MSTGEDRGTETFDWYVETDHAGAELPAGVGSRLRRSERRANSLALAITTSMLFILVSAAVMVGGHAAVLPLLRHTVATRDAQSLGDVVYAMPDGVFCRHMAFDNATAEVTEAAVEHCPRPIGGERPGPTKFEWGGR